MSVTKAFNQANGSGLNKFILAIEEDNYPLVHYFTTQGADLSFQTRKQGLLSEMIREVPYAEGATPLHVACLLGRLEITVLLLDKGAPLQLKDKNGRTALDYAVLSYMFFKDLHEKRSASAFSTRGRAKKAADRQRTQADIIEKMIAAGAKTAVLALPDVFRAAPREMPPPPAPPQP